MRGMEDREDRGDQAPQGLDDRDEGGEEGVQDGEDRLSDCLAQLPQGVRVPGGHPLRGRGVQVRLARRQLLGVGDGFGSGGPFVQAWEEFGQGGGLARVRFGHGIGRH